MRTSRYRKPFFMVGLLGALLLPAVVAAQVQEARVHIDGMV
jgi:hypothetical protein